MTDLIGRSSQLQQTGQPMVADRACGHMGKMRDRVNPYGNPHVLYTKKE